MSSIAVVGISYLLICLGLGILGRNKTKKQSSSESAYYAAGGSAKSFMSAMGIVATIMSASSFMGYIGIGYSLGLPFMLLFIAATMMSMALLQFLLVDPIRKFGNLTVFEFYEFRYKAKWLKISYVFLLVATFSIGFVGNLKAIGLTGSYILGISPFASQLIIVGVFLAFIILGGVWAVIYTDFFQGILMFISMFALSAVCIYNLGGVGTMFTEAIKLRPHMGTNILPITSYLGFFIMMVFAIFGKIEVLARVLTTESVSVARKATKIGGLLMMLFYILGVTVVLLAAVNLFPALSDSDTALLSVIEAYFPPFLQAIISAAILSATMSSLSSGLIVVSSFVGHDIYRRMINENASDKQVIVVGSISIILLCGFSIYMAQRPIALMGVIIAMAGGIAVIPGGLPLGFGIWWKRTTTAGALSGMLASSASFAVLWLFFKMPAFSQVLVSIPVGVLTVIIVSLLTEPPSEMVQRVVEKLRDPEEQVNLDEVTSKITSTV